MRRMLTALYFTFAAGAAGAATITIEAPAADEVETVRQIYDCGGARVEVVYHNAGTISLAVLTIGGETIVASNVLAASGVRYAGAQYVWWTKGDDADLYDLTQGEDAPPVSCRTLAP